MIIDCTKHTGPCACGDTHHMQTQKAIIEAGCLRDLDRHLGRMGYAGRRAALYDTNTYHAKGLTRPQVDQEIILNADSLNADDTAVAAVLQQLQGDTALLIAVGAGTIHDIARYCAHRLGIPFVSCPTAASVDSYAASHCLMTWRGAPVILPGVAPVLVLADLDVIQSAPTALALAGVGEAISKFTAIADWKIAALLTGGTPCPMAESILRQAAVAAQGACEGLARQESGAYAQLMYALLLSGIAAQMAGTHAPASGAAHLLSQLMRLLPNQYGAQEPLPHGEVVGVCTAVIAGLYHRLAEIEDITPLLRPHVTLTWESLARSFGESMAATLLEENTADCLHTVRSESLAAHWEAIRRILMEIPAQSTLEGLLRTISAKATMKELGVASAKLPAMLRLSPSLRNQLTLTRMLRMIDFDYDSSDAASRAPSRKSLYADSAMIRAGSSNAVSASSMR